MATPLATHASTTFGGLARDAIAIYHTVRHRNF
jgi:hypothetical protein